MFFFSLQSFHETLVSHEHQVKKRRHFVYVTIFREDALSNFLAMIQGVPENIKATDFLTFYVRPFKVKGGNFPGNEIWTVPPRTPPPPP